MIGAPINFADCSIGSPIKYADCLIGSPVTWHYTGTQTVEAAPVPAVAKAELREQLAAAQATILAQQKKAAAANKARAAPARPLKP